MTDFGGQSEVAPLGRVMLKAPKAAFACVDTIEAQWQELGYLRQPDLGRAMDEHRAMSALLEERGIQVDLLPAHATATLDSIYVRDASVLTDRGMILCNMGKEYRASEPHAQGEAFHDLGIPILGEIGGEGQLEGGDFVWLDETTAAVGRGYRTNDEGIRQLRDLLGEGIHLEVVPLPHWKGSSDVFHLMSVLSPLAPDLALVYSPLLPIPFREFLLDRGVGLVEVPDQEFESMGCNVVALAPRVCLMLEGNPMTQGRLEVAGVEALTYRGQEISVPGSGGPTCLTRPLLREF
jgi:N-dimethylarginine dimethylaminohydrolase